MRMAIPTYYSSHYRYMIFPDQLDITLQIYRPAEKWLPVPDPCHPPSMGSKKQNGQSVEQGKALTTGRERLVLNVWQEQA